MNLNVRKQMMKAMILLMALLSTVIPATASENAPAPAADAKVTAPATNEKPGTPNTADTTKDAAQTPQAPVSPDLKPATGPSGGGGKSENASKTEKQGAEKKPPAEVKKVEPAQKGEHPNASVDKEGARVQEWLKDRPWITRPKVTQKPDAAKEKKKTAIQWTDKKQEAACMALPAQLEENLEKARYYSIQGDTCSTAKHAAMFLDTVSTCREKCPPGFLESNGYNDGIIRNLKVLRELGKKRCLGPQ